MFLDKTLNPHQRQCEVNSIQAEVITYRVIHTQILFANVLFTKVELLIIAIIIEYLWLVKVFLCVLYSFA